jgi:hypothetical protein
MTESLKVLVGQKIRAIYVKEAKGDGEDAIAFVTDRGTFAFDTDSDCCSETWFADITSPQAVLNGYCITSVTAMEFPEHDDREPDPRSRQEYDEVMGFEIKTWKGVCQIIYRNSSNGYYGGSLEPCYVPDNIEGWTQITTDWRA